MHRGLRVLGAVALAAFTLVVVGVTVGAVLFDAGDASTDGDPQPRVENVDAAVRVNPDDSLPDPDGDGVSNCVSYGPPPGGLRVVANVDVVDTRAQERRYGVEASLQSAGVTEETTVAVGERRRVELRALTQDAGGIEPGDTVTVRLAVTHDGETVATERRDIVVEAFGGATDCED